VQHPLSRILAIFLWHANSFVLSLVIVCVITFIGCIISMGACVTNLASFNGIFLIRVNFDFLSTTVTNIPT